MQVDDHLNIFLEYMDGGSLRRLLERGGPMSEGQAAVITRKVLSGLSYLHSEDIAHRDIKVWSQSASQQRGKEGGGVSAQ